MASRLKKVAQALGAALIALLLLPASAQTPPLVVGAVVSQTGSHAAAAVEYQRGLMLWRDEVNASGGLLGRAVELRILDDGSEAVRAGSGYAELIAAGAEVLIGPYGSAATLTAAAEAERARRVLLNAAGPSSQVHKRSPRYVFQTLAPYSAYAGLDRSSPLGKINFPYEVPWQQANQMDDDALSIMENKAMQVPGEEGLRDIRIVQAIHQSAATGQRVKV